MRRCLSLLAISYLSSCTHTAESPLRDAAGTPVVIRIPGIPKGQLPKPVDVMSIDADLFAGSSAEQMAQRSLPRLKSTGQNTVKIDGMTGEMKTLRGEVFHAYFPIVKIDAAASQAEVDAAACSVARELYARAVKKCRVYPMSDLAVRE